MSSAMYYDGVNGFGDGSFSWTGSTIKVMLVNAAYVFEYEHKFVTDIGSNDNGRSNALTGTVVSNKAFIADNTAVIATSHVLCNALVVYQDSGSDATSRLIYYMGAAYTGLPFTPGNTQNIRVTWDTGINKIFRL